MSNQMINLRDFAEKEGINLDAPNYFALVISEDSDTNKYRITWFSHDDDPKALSLEQFRLLILTMSAMAASITNEDLMLPEDDDEQA